MNIDESKVCCCITVRSAAIWIAILSTIGSLFLVVNVAVILDGDENIVLDDRNIEDSDEVKSYMQSALIISCVIFALEFLFSILVLLGIYANRDKLLLPYLILGALALIFYALDAIVRFINDLIKRDNTRTGFVFGNLLAAIIGCIITYVFLHVVHLQFKRIKQISK